MKNISLIIFILFNYFFAQKFFETKNIQVNNEVSYQKTFSDLIGNKEEIIHQNNITEEKIEIIYLY